MSRAYKIRVAESLKRGLNASDEICSELELLEILPPEQMAELLKKALKGRGFEEKPDGTMSRTQGELTTTVDPKTGQVTARTEASAEVELHQETDGWGYDDVGPSQSVLEQRLRKQVQEDLEKRAEGETERLQSQATEKLAGHMDDLRRELGRVVNEVTRESLKRKAQSMGEIKEIDENAETGSLTIKVEV